MRTVKDVTFDLLRQLGLTTIVGNPGSTEETFLKNFPADFDYVLALQEASVVGIADGLSQGLRKPVIVNVHTGGRPRQCHGLHRNRLSEQDAADPDGRAADP